MDLYVSSATTLVIDENSKKVLSKRNLFLSTYIRSQPWAVPDTVIYYITKNPSSTKVYQKLILSCKYFYIKNSILNVARIFLYYEKNECKTLFNGKEIDLKNINCKIWITDYFFCDSNVENNVDQNLATLILPKIFQSDVNKISIWNQNIGFNDLVFLASKCQIINLHTVTVLDDENGSDTAVEKIVEAFPLVKEFYFYVGGNIAATEIISSKTAKNLIKIPHFAKIIFFKLVNVPECFDIDTFYSYIKKNKKTQIFLSFVQNISEQYQNRLQSIVNEIIQAEIRDYRSPFIYFNGMDESSKNKLWNLYGH